MFHNLKYRRLGWLGVALLSGVVLGGLMPNTPLHAVATDHYKTFVVATGPVDDDIEAIFFLDFPSGTLSAAVLSVDTGRFMAFYARNVLGDLGIDQTKNPHYLMVTGAANLRQSAVLCQSGRTVVYVAEVTTGRVAAYAVPWTPGMKSLRHPVKRPLKLLDVTQFRNVAVLQPR